MPLDDIQVDEQMERSLKKAGVGIETQKAETGPVYRMMGDSKIPVSKHMGSLWQSRRDQGLKARSTSETCWDEAIRYYDNDQSAHRTEAENGAGNRLYARRMNNQFTETENVVFSNCSIMVPMLYAKNPSITATSDITQHEGLCRTVERLLNKLMSQKNAPGLNFKVKVRRAVLTALLTNSAFVKIGWTAKQDSDAEAIKQLGELSSRLEKAKSKKEIKEVEGELVALEEKIALLGPSGPFCRNLLPHRLVVDPTSVEPDGSDANWMMEWDMLPTSYINAVYAQKHGEEYRSVYEPTHVLNSGEHSDSHLDDIVNNFTLLKDESELKAQSYGYKHESAFKAASYTKVWYVWDKTTRRVLMFADNNWRWPLWVWDDPLKLPRFFPYFRLWFHEAVNAQAPKGEVTYYLDQQDAINEINDEVRRGRAWAKRNIFYNKNLIKQVDVEAVLTGPDGTCRGIDVPDGQKLDDCLFSLTPPALRFPELFNTDTKFAAINRITGINDAQRGAQFKTNTTNDAVDTYNKNTEIRVDERVDLIEDFIADIIWNVAMLAMMNWEADDVAPFVGPELAAAWQRVTDPRMFQSMLSIRVEAGSIAKPNSSTKKKQAVELAQVLGQFANAAPATVIVMMKMIERAFDEVIINDEEWQMILQTMQMALQKAGQGPNGEGAEQQQAGSDEELKEQVKQKIASLPPAAQQQLEQLVQQGMSPSDALKQIEGQLQSVSK